MVCHDSWWETQRPSCQYNPSDYTARHSKQWQASEFSFCPSLRSTKGTPHLGLGISKRTNCLLRLYKTTVIRFRLEPLACPSLGKPKLAQVCVLLCKNTDGMFRISHFPCTCPSIPRKQMQTYFSCLIAESK